MKKILILMGRYLPGYKDGGPVRSIINLTEALGDEYEFYILTQDRDHGDLKPYDNIRYNEWMTVGKAKVQYVKPKGFTFKLIRKLIGECDLVYTCGFYNDYGYKTLILNRLNKLTGKPVVVASMGSFSAGALIQKSVKKKVFIGLCKFFGLFNNIVWSVTSELECVDLKNTISKEAEYIIAEDIPRFNIPNISFSSNKSDILNVAFLSRISPKKNLLGAIRVLSKVSSNINFSIYGPDEDKDYFESCIASIQKLPDNIVCEYKGNVPSERVQEELAKNEVFLFPTLGENYGHVIFEALSVGCIPIISDTTPWLDLESFDCGFVFSLNDLDSFANAIDTIAKMDLVQLNNMRKKCVQYAIIKKNDSIINTGYRRIFDEL